MVDANSTANISNWKLFVRSARPRQWIKNSFIVAPAVFTLQILNVNLCLSLIAGVAGFSLVASAIYIINDILNRHEDALHPVKRNRPIASGQLNISLAVILASVLLMSGFIILWLLGRSVLATAVIYALLMWLYSAYLRKLLILDVIIIASGFVLRVILGAFIIGEPVSHWLILCTFTIALFLAMIKRRQEIVYRIDGENTDPDRNTTRSVLSSYPAISIIDGWINILAAMTIICYALYTVDPETIAKHHTEYLIYTLPFALYGIFRYQQLALTDRGGEDPTGLIIKDSGIKIVVILWMVVVIAILLVARGVI